MTSLTLIAFLGTLSLTESYELFAAFADAEFGDNATLNAYFKAADDLKKSAILNVLFLARAEGVDMTALTNIAQSEVFDIN